MDKIVTTTLPPAIIQHFSAKLLSVPCPKFNEDSKDLWIIYQYIKTKLLKKTKKFPQWEKECLALEKQFMELYERALAKEKEHAEKKTHFTQESFYRFADIDRANGKILTGLKFRSKGWSLPYFI